MSQIAYSLDQATAALGLTDVTNSTIIEAVRSGDLLVRELGSRSKWAILHADLEAWAAGMPEHVN